MREPLNQVYELHIESSDSCNLRCNYCYFTSKKANKSPFPLSQLEKVLGAFFAKAGGDVNMVFHGGEPLMNPAEWIEGACEIAKQKARQNGHEVSFHLQTNGVLLTPAYVEVLKRYGFSVNVSLDGPESIHNAARGAYARTVESIRMLQDAGVFMGVITVIGKHNYDKTPQVVQHLMELGVKKYHFNIGSILSDRPELILTTDEMMLYYRESLDCFMATYKQSCNWVLLGKLRRFISGSIPQLACDSPICGAGIHKIHLLPNGDYYPCGSCVNTPKGTAETVLGNIFEDLPYDDYQRKLVAFQMPYFNHKQTCEQCEAALICDFICPAFDPLDPTTFAHRCEAAKQFYAHLQTLDRARIEQIVSYYADCHE